MIKILTKITILTLILIQLQGCLDPNYYIWKDSKDLSNNNLPWSGVNKKPIREYRRYVAPMSGTGYGIDRRWSISFFNKKTADKIDKKISKFLLEKRLLKRWNQRYSRSGRIYKGFAPYELTMISINPIIITMRSYVKYDIEKDSYAIEHPRNTSYIITDYLINPYHYGITFKYQPDLLYFSPDLKILPQPLNLKRGETTNIYWKKGRIEFIEKKGKVYTRRLANKAGRSNEEEYDPNYHFTLIPKEQETIKKWQQYQQELRNKNYQKQNKKNNVK